MRRYRGLLILKTWLVDLSSASTIVGGALALGAIAYLALHQAGTATLTALISAVAFAVVVAVLLLAFRELGRTRRRLDETTQVLNQAPMGPAETAAAPLPRDFPSGPLELPAQVVQALNEGSCTLYAGSDFAVLAMMPHQERILAALLADAPVDDVQRSSLYRELQERNQYLVADVLAGEVGQRQLASAVDELAQTVSPDLSSSTMRAFKRVPFSGAITDSWYDVLERLYAGRTPVVLTPEEGEAAPSLLRRAEFFIAHLYGVTGRPDSLNFPGEDYGSWTIDREFSRFIASIFASQTVLFIGSTERDILRVIGDVRVSEGPPHYAVLPWDPGLPARTARLQTRGVNVLPYVDPEQLEAFAEQLAQVARQPTPADRRTAPPLGRVRLENIGPFRELDLSLEERVTVLLGDNGSGKSSVLRAIALALLGENAGTAEAAGQLLRAGAPSGRIELTLGDDTYKIEIHGDRLGTVLQAHQISPVEAGLWLALGFPPARGFTGGGISGPSVHGDPDPHIDDLRPLAMNGPDPRLSDVEQWLVNTAVSADEKGRQGGRARETLDRFFEIVGELTPGVDFSYAGIDRERWRVMLDTPDGVLTMSQLSRGMSAVLGWVGVLIQRLVEVEGSPGPSEARALLLVDEVDLHLHPGWQREMLPILCKHFPELQIVVSTHSPLVVGSLRGARLIHLLRRDGHLEAQTVEEDYTGWRADQILTSGAFELETTRDLATVEQIDRYRELSESEDPVARAQAADLAESLHRQIPGPQETPLARSAARIVNEALEQRLASVDASEREQLRRAAEEYLASLEEAR